VSLLMKARRFALNPKKRWIACPTLILVLGTGCSSSLDNRQRSTAAGTAPATKPGQNKSRFRNPEMDALYQAAKAAPRTFDPVYVYAKTVADASLVSLVDKSCATCTEGAVRYKRRSELEPHYWPIIEEDLSMLGALGNAPGLTSEQTDRLIATKGRLLWLAGRSVEEQTMIDEYAQAHPNAVAVIRRRLELLREAGDTASLESQCTRSRAKTESAAEADRVDLLTACVAFHPRNGQGRSDLLEYARYLPNLSRSEETVYRTNLVQRCVEKVGDEETRCEEACACEDKDPGKKPDAKCKRACGGCRSDTAQKLHLCKKIAEAPSVAVRVPQPKEASVPPKTDAPPVSAPRPKTGAPAPRHKDSGLKQMEL
jgi:hypothetical protein